MVAVVWPGGHFIRVDVLLPGYAQGVKGSA